LKDALEGNKKHRKASKSATRAKWGANPATSSPPATQRMEIVKEVNESPEIIQVKKVEPEPKKGITLFSSDGQ